MLPTLPERGDTQGVVPMALHCVDGGVVHVRVLRATQNAILLWVQMCAYGNSLVLSNYLQAQGCSLLGISQSSQGLGVGSVDGLEILLENKI